LKTLLRKDFFDGDVLEVAPKLIGKLLVREFEDGTEICRRIKEVEAYRGEEDLACHASKGRTPRTETMYMKAGTIYVYLIYGMYWMLNIVTAPQNVPQAILIRSIEGFEGPGKLTKKLKIDKSFNQQNIFTNGKLFIVEDEFIANYETKKRVGIDYSGEIWANKLWRWSIIN